MGTGGHLLTVPQRYTSLPCSMPETGNRLSVPSILHSTEAHGNCLNPRRPSAKLAAPSDDHWHLTM
jgi:hypothetical protein